MPTVLPAHPKEILKQRLSQLTAYNASAIRKQKGEPYRQYTALSELDPNTVTYAQLKSILGVVHHDYQSCDNCGADCGIAAVELGEECYYDSRTATVCLPCLKSAVATLEQFVAEHS